MDPAYPQSIRATFLAIVNGENRREKRRNGGNRRETRRHKTRNERLSDISVALRVLEQKEYAMARLCGVRFHIDVVCDCAVEIFDSRKTVPKR